MIKGWLLGGDDLVRRMAGVSPEIQNALQTSVSRMALKLLNKVQDDKLTGQALKVRSGRLRRSINQRVQREGQGVYGYVGTNVAYAKPHEYGFNGSVSVKAHLRKMTQAFGRQVPAKEIMVQAHSRKVHLPERSFLRSALREMQSAIEQEMRSAVNKAAKGVK